MGNKKHITTSIYDKNENFCFSKDYLKFFSKKTLKEKKAKNTSRFRLLKQQKKTAVHHMCVSLKDDFGIRHFSRKFFRHHQQEKKKKNENERLKKNVTKKKNREKKQKKVVSNY